MIKNISKHNIIINEKLLAQNKTMKISEDELENLSGLIESGMLEVQNTKAFEQQNEDYDHSVISGLENMKERIIPALFSLHLNLELTEDELIDLKWFFKNVGPTSQLDNNLKSLLDDTNDYEEFLEVLLNHLYPELIKEVMNKKRKFPY